MASIARQTPVADSSNWVCLPVRLFVYALPESPCTSGKPLCASAPQRISSAAGAGCRCPSRSATRSGVMPSAAAALGSAFAQSSAWATSGKPLSMVL